MLRFIDLMGGFLAGDGTKSNCSRTCFVRCQQQDWGWKTPRLLVATRAKRCAFNQQILDLTDMGLQPEQGEDSGEDLTYLTNWRYTLIYTQTTTN